jgi:hypothetical protein
VVRDSPSPLPKDAVMKPPSQTLPRDLWSNPGSLPSDEALEIKDALASLTLTKEQIADMRKAAVERVGAFKTGVRSVT